MVDLSRFDNSNFRRGTSRPIEFLWWVVRSLLFAPWIPIPSACKVVALRAFGARVGRGVVIRSRVNVSFPWNLTIGDHVWIGDEVYILSLAKVVIGNHVCISQRAFLCTGNHDYRSVTFDLKVAPIALQDGCWIGAGAQVGPGVTIGRLAVLGFGSVATGDLEPQMIHRGSPAAKYRARFPESYRAGTTD
jgi:putative colanic acid biosynthesis acetyltransferase WcaF